MEFPIQKLRFWIRLLLAKYTSVHKRKAIGDFLGGLCADDFRRRRHNPKRTTCELYLELV